MSNTKPPCNEAMFFSLFRLIKRNEQQNNDGKTLDVCDGFLFELLLYYFISLLSFLRNDLRNIIVQSSLRQRYSSQLFKISSHCKYVMRLPTHTLFSTRDTATNYLHIVILYRCAAISFRAEWYVRWLKSYLHLTVLIYLLSVRSCFDFLFLSLFLTHIFHCTFSSLTRKMGV